MKTTLGVKSYGPEHHGGKHSLPVGYVVVMVGAEVQIEVGVGGFLHMLCLRTHQIACKCQNREEKGVISFCLHHELDVSVDTFQMVQETPSASPVHGTVSQMCQSNRTSRGAYGFPSQVPLPRNHP